MLNSIFFSLMVEFPDIKLLKLVWLPLFTYSLKMTKPPLRAIDKLPECDSIVFKALIPEFLTQSLIVHLITFFLGITSQRLLLGLSLLKLNARELRTNVNIGVS